MIRFSLACISLSLVALCSGYTVVQPEISLLQPKGLQFAYPDDGSVNLVSYHYSINQPLAGVAAGQYNQDVSGPTNGYFIYDNTAVAVAPGDIVNYWVNVITTGGGYTLTDQSWVAVVAETTTSTTSTTTTMAVDTTTQSTTTKSTPKTTTTVSSTAATTDGVITESTTTSSGGGSGITGGGSSGTSCNSYPCESGCDASAPPCNGLIFEENWETLDLTRWQHEITMSGGGNWEFQYYTNNRTNSYVKDNTLFIQPTLTSDHYGEAFLSSGTLDLWGGTPADLCTANSFWGCQRTGSASNYLNPIQSARIRSVNSFSFKYGRVELEAKLPKGDWIWPAIWLLPKDQQYGIWPASGEVDLMESRGNAGGQAKDSNGVSHGVDEWASTLHWGPYYGANRYDLTTDSVHLPNNGEYSDDFHSYVFEWNEDGMEFFIDDVSFMTVAPDDDFWTFGDFDQNQPGSYNPWATSANKNAPFDQEFYFIINVAVGGTNGYFSDSWTYTNPGGKPWSNSGSTAFKDFWLAKNNWYPTWDGENAALQVKSIKVWAN